MREITKIESQDIRPVKRKRVAAYARVSSGKDAQLHSLSAQISYYNSYIGSRGDWELAGIYADGAYTGTKENRPEFQRMLEDCKAGKIDMVITKSITRFARNTLTLLSTVRDLKSLGIDVFFEKENIHSLSMDGELMLTLLASFAQEESRSVSENLKWMIRKKFEQGIPTWASLLGYQFKDGNFYVIPEEAEIVKQIFTDYLSGMGLNTIAKKLVRQKVPTKYGEPWNKNSIQYILQNEKYTGCLLLQKTYSADAISKKKMRNSGQLPMYYVENSHEAIISQEMFDQVQQELKHRAKVHGAHKSASNKHLYTGLIHCGICGKHFYRRLMSSGKAYPKKTFWLCATYFEQGRDACPSQKIPEDILTAKTAEVLGVTEFDREMLMSQIKEIQVPGHNRLVYVFHDGHSEETTWQHKSRKDGWTEEMKQKAREKSLAYIAERRKNAGKSKDGS